MELAKAVRATTEAKAKTGAEVASVAAAICQMEMRQAALEDELDEMRWAMAPAEENGLSEAALVHHPEVICHQLECLVHGEVQGGAVLGCGLTRSAFPRVYNNVGRMTVTGG